MAFKITKAEEKRIAEIAGRLSAKFDGINAIIEKMKSEIDDELVEYNEIREELRGVLEDIHSEKESEYEDKSDNWREGDRGEATYSWIEGLSDIMNEFADDLELDLDLEIDKPDELTKLLDEGLPAEPEY